jgi:hypothetical protein
LRASSHTSKSHRRNHQTSPEKKTTRMKMMPQSDS